MQVNGTIKGTPLNVSVDGLNATSNATDEAQPGAVSRGIGLTPGYTNNGNVKVRLTLNPTFVGCVANPDVPSAFGFGNSIANSTVELEVGQNAKPGFDVVVDDIGTNPGTPDGSFSVDFNTSVEYWDGTQYVAVQ